MAPGRPPCRWVLTCLWVGVLGLVASSWSLSAQTVDWPYDDVYDSDHDIDDGDVNDLNYNDVDDVTQSSSSMSRSLLSMWSVSSSSSSSASSASMWPLYRTGLLIPP